MNKLYKFLFSLVFLCCAAPFCDAADGDLEKAESLYASGLYAGSLNILQRLPGYGNDPMIDGYASLCAQKLHLDGYRETASAYLERYPESRLTDAVRLETALDYFDTNEYEVALAAFNALDKDGTQVPERAEFHFKKGYCQYRTGDTRSALGEFSTVESLVLNDYTSPSRYCTGYILYRDGNFAEAVPWFEKASADERFAPIAKYYIVNCHYELKDFAFVVDKGVEMFNTDVPKDRKDHLARIISESFLVLGDKKSAREYFDKADEGEMKTRADLFYAGSLMYATGDWKNAVENYEQMPEKTDSLGQIALYNTALAYINLKNKVAALDSFKGAAALTYDAKMTEDAMFNYAKLSFDLNGDTSVFADYLRKYSDSVRGEKIYSYMALASLANKDWQSAIDFYDKIDMLTGPERNNYVHANYLRGAELLENGSYRQAIQCMKAVTYYAPKNDRVNQLARYALGEAYYRNRQYGESCGQFVELYNASALYGMPQAEMLSYSAAYSYLRNGDYIQAGKWFDVYVRDGGKSCRKDALTRKADCFFAQNLYKEAAETYAEVMNSYPDGDDLYVCYQCAVASGLTKELKKNKLQILENVRKAKTSTPYYAQVMFELGKTQSEKKMTSAALESFQTIVDSLPGDAYAAKALLEIGTLKRNSKDVEGALAAYKTVVEKMPASGCGDDALLAIESIYQSQNSPDKYLAYIEQIGKGETKTDEQRQAMLFSSAEQLFYSDQWQQALAAFDNIIKTYPGTVYAVQSWYYTGECYRCLGDKEHSCDAYAVVIADTSSVRKEDATARFARLNLELENFDTARNSYRSLLTLASTPATLSSARVGLMRSAYKAKDYQSALEGAELVQIDTVAGAVVKRESKMLQARSLLATSRRDEAFAVLGKLSDEPASAEGAEACYMLIQDSFDKADFESVEKKVYAFGDSGTTQQYWLARSFIVLGDSYAEQGRMKQAEATFQSIADGYRGDDEIASEVAVRLDKIKEMKQ